MRTLGHFHQQIFFLSLQPKNQNKEREIGKNGMQNESETNTCSCNNMTLIEPAALCNKRCFEDQEHNHFIFHKLYSICRCCTVGTSKAQSKCL